MFLQTSCGAVENDKTSRIYDNNVR